MLPQRLLKYLWDFWVFQMSPGYGNPREGLLWNIKLYDQNVLKCKDPRPSRIQKYFPRLQGKPVKFEKVQYSGGISRQILISRDRGF